MLERTDGINCRYIGFDYSLSIFIPDTSHLKLLASRLGQLREQHIHHGLLLVIYSYWPLDPKEYDLQLGFAVPFTILGVSLMLRFR